MNVQKAIITNDLNELPAPFCYRFKIEIVPGREPTVGFDVEYYDREELDPEEIEAEGFSLEDDFNWKGSLPAVWRREILRQLEDSEPGHVKKGADIFLVSDGKGEHYQPKDPATFERFTQQLIQAIYEASEKQNSLSIKAVYLLSSKKIENYELKVSFLNRDAQIVEGKKSREVQWENAQKMLEMIFQHDFDPFAAIPKLPKKEGMYIDPGDGMWYEAGTGFIGQQKKNPTEEILSLFRSLS